jgi:translation initiation factor 3 subunit J
MASWEDDDFEVGTTVGRATAGGRFDDEEEDDDVADAWDAESEDESKQAAVVAPAKKKGTLKEALKRREELTAAEEAAREEARANAAPEETPEERRLRQKEMELQSDLNNAADLFGAAHITEEDKTLLKSQIKGATLSDILDPAPKTRDEFAEACKTLVTGITTLGKAKEYPQFMVDLVKGLCEPLNAEDTRKVQASLNVLVNAKNLAEKGGPQKKKKAAGKPGLAKMGAATASYNKALDTSRLDDGYDDDFM